MPLHGAEILPWVCGTCVGLKKEEWEQGRSKSLEKCFTRDVPPRAVSPSDSATSSLFPLTAMMSFPLLNKIF